MGISYSHRHIPSDHIIKFLARAKQLDIRRVCPKVVIADPGGGDPDMGGKPAMDLQSGSKLLALHRFFHQIVKPSQARVEFDGLQYISTTRSLFIIPTS